ncbi:hypothetical protein S7711_05990 [Stachybotrys chartarum IBT 7711]|uniref:Uncharacterized protein n=1 Tax=Stachybotrys chartarum (strain CBS 109288 / IBT 7711) TaxID=1280523 RepID=A0A084B2S0_STACB|nr:hypothetical protein S7711_05990 [Stachybotrys chartarum IBT 7711]KFA50440.1 hypothetical protein S40293_08953 [Stachybotrys chartarum IBT 40293]
MSTTTTTTISTHPVAFHPAADHLRQAALRKKMSITQTYYLAHKARAKLSREAAQPDHDLRLLVGHANLLDSLMLELAEAEREQERWFNQSVRGASHKTQERRVQWADRIEEEAVDYDSDSSDDSSDDDYDEEDIEMLHVPAPPKDDEEMMEDDLEEDYAQLELVRTPSHSNSPPELVSHQDSDSSDDESMPPSPPEASMPFPAKKQDKDNSFYEDGFYLPPRNPATISVY